MNTQPIIETNRLSLRPFASSDAKLVQTYAGDIRLAEMVSNIPHPYEDGMAEQWINAITSDWESYTQPTFAVCDKQAGTLYGCCSLTVNRKHNRGELGYWFGVDHWGNGYCTEAAKALVEFGFSTLNLHRIEARHLVKNSASGKVMQKIGMRHEATLADYFLKDGVYQSLELYCVLHEVKQE